MKEGWTYKKLGEVCEILDSMRKPITKDKREPGDIPYYGATGCLDYVKDYIFDEKLVLLGEDGAKWGAGDNSAYIINGKTWVNNHAHALRPKRNIMIDELLVYYLNFSNLQPFITGVTVPKLNQEKMRSIEIPVPPLPEQRAIVARLDSAFAQIDSLKANAEKQLSEARKLFQKALEEAMTPKEGWTYKTLGEVIDHLRTGLNPRTHFKLNTPDADCYYITVRELKGFTINPDEKTDKVNRAAIKRINERSNLKIGDVLFSGTGTIGKTALVSELPEKWNIKEGVYAMTPKHSELDSKYFIYYIGSEFFLRLVNDKAAGTGVRSIPMKELVKLPIPVPPLSTQHSIVAHLDALSSNVRALEAKLRKMKDECDALKQAMLREVFE